MVDEASAAVSALENVKDEIRFDLNTYAIEVVNDTNFFNLDVVANNTEVPHQAMSSTRTDMRYTVNQDYYGRIPRTTSPQGDHSELLSEEQLQRLCGIMYDFAKQVGYGLRTYNKEAGSSSTSSSTSSAMLNIHQLALMLRGMPQGMDHPLAYALNSFQAFTVCLHAIYKYTSWRAYDTNEPYYWWSAEIMPDAETTTLEFLEHHIEAVCKPQRENGLHLPPDLKLYAWNQLAVESGYVHECILKRTALQSWEDGFNNMGTAPVLCYDGDGLFPPKLSVNPNGCIIQDEAKLPGRMFWSLRA